METENNKGLYLHMIFGSIGMILMAVAMFQFLVTAENPTNYLIFAAGFVIIIDYIYRLERQAGISNKLIWIRAIFIILLLAGVYSFLE